MRSNSQAERPIFRLEWLQSDFADTSPIYEISISTVSVVAISKAE
jgi:hypothetical protein